MWTNSNVATFLWGLALLSSLGASAGTDDAKARYPAMAPLAQYQIASPTEEIALARTAAPNSISSDADILTLGNSGYETPVKGKNGFVCVVERSWGAGFDDAEFWNPKIRAPICFNPVAARTVLPAYLERTQWVLAGVARPDMFRRTQAELMDSTFVLPEPGAMSYMMSRHGYLSDAVGHWHPHLMFYVAHTTGAAWGADLKGSPTFSAQGDPEPVTTFFVPIATWSDGSSAAMRMR